MLATVAIFVSLLHLQNYYKQKKKKKKKPICVNLVYVGDFVLSYLLNPTTYEHETCTIGYNKD